MSDRILTVRQPWASAIIEHGKDVENRSWSTGYRGRLWIHAGLIIDDSAALDLGDVPLGVIIGHVELVDVVADSSSAWAQPGCWHWVLESPRACRPRPYTGALGLRHFSTKRS